MVDSLKAAQKRPIILILALLFSVLIVAENISHVAHSLVTIFSSPPEPQTALSVGAYLALPLALLWASWAYLRKRKRGLVLFGAAALGIFLMMDYWLPYPGPAKKAFFMFEEGRRIYGVVLQDSIDAPFLTKQGNPIGISFRYTMRVPAGGEYLVQTHLSPASQPLRPEDAGVDPGGSALGVLAGPDEWVTAPSRMSVTRTRNAIPKFIIYNPSKGEFCLFSQATDLLKGSPGLTKYRVEFQVGGKQTFLDQIAILQFETHNSYDVRNFYESAVKEHMPLCSP